MLEEYVEELGDARVPKKFRVNEEFRLGSWCLHQRIYFKKKTIAESRVDKLNELEFVWNILEADWFQAIEHLKVFISRKGSCDVPSRFKTEDGFGLGSWANKQRKEYKNSSLDEERIAILQNLNFVWDPNEAWWNDGIKHLKKFVDINAHAMVGKGYQTESGFKLAGWVFSQRTRRKQGLLTEHKIAQLDSLQFVWDANEYLWELGFQELKLYFEENGNTLVPEKKRDGINYPLANWVGPQRGVYRSGKLSKNRIYKLEELNFVWDPLEFLWQENLEELGEFIKNHGHSSISNNYKTKSGGSLRDWIQDQRQSKKNGNLTTTRKNKLDLIGLNWQPSDDFWTEGIQYLKKYIKVKKSANVPLRFVTEDDFALGNWVSTRRRNYKRGILSREAIAELNQLGFTWDVLGDK